MTHQNKTPFMVQPDRNNPEGNPKSGVMVVGFMGFVAILSFAMQGPILSLFIVDLGATVGILGIILSARGIIEIILRIPFASASDKVGRRFLSFLGLICFTITPLILMIAGLMKTWLIIIIALMVQSVGFSSLIPSLIAYVSDIYPPERSGEVLGRLFRMNDLGHIFGPLITGFLVSILGLSYTQVFAVSFGVSVLGIFIARSLFKETSKIEMSVKETGKIILQEIFRSFHMIRVSVTNRATLAPNLAIFFFAASVTSLVQFFPLLGRDRNLIEGEIGIAMSSRRALAWFFKIRLGMVSDVYGRSISVVLSLIAIAVIIGVISLTHSFLWFVILIGAVGFLQGIGMPAINGAIVDVAPETERGTYIGTWGVFFSAGRAFSLFMFGVVATYFGIDAVFVVAGIWVALGAIAFRLVRLPVTVIPIAEVMEPIAAFKEINR